MIAEPTRELPRKQAAGSEPKEQVAEPMGTGALSDVGAHLSEIREHLGHLVQAQADAVKGKLLRAAIVVVLTFAGLVAVVSSVATVVVLLISGLAGGVSTLVGNRIWLGNAITAIVLMAVSTFTIRYQWTRFKAARLRELVGKYERRKQRGRARFNRATGDV